MLTQERLREVLHYDPDTGVFTWLRDTSRVRAGRQAGSLDAKGYRRIQFEGKGYKAHRLAFLYMLGRWPIGTPDHRNTDGDDNRWLNLRDATFSQNNGNRSRTKSHKTGFKGVYLADGLYVARIMKDGVRYSVGYFKDPETAHAAYAAKARELFGEFARVA
jgi:hypothetical protein